MKIFILILVLLSSNNCSKNIRNFTYKEKCKLRDIAKNVDEREDDKNKSSFAEKGPVQSTIEVAFDEGMFLEESKIEDEIGNLSDNVLLHASKMGHKKAVENLISNGVNVNYIDQEEGCSSLMFASMNGHVEVVELLLNNGAKIDSRDFEGKNSLIIAAKNNHSEIVELLLSYGADIDSKDKYGWTSLMHASQFNNRVVLRILFSVGINISAIDNQGRSAATIALHNGHRNLARLLGSLEENRDDLVEILEAGGLDTDDEDI